MNLPLLATAESVDFLGPLRLQPGAPDGEMEPSRSRRGRGRAVQYVGGAAIQGKVPDAYLIYFRHAIQDKDFKGEHKLLETGIGDYLIGRMQTCRQVLNSGKNVAVVLPVGKSGLGKFESNEGFVEQCLTDINDQLFNAATPPPLLLACSATASPRPGHFAAPLMPATGRPGQGGVRLRRIARDPRPRHHAVERWWRPGVPV